MDARRSRAAWFAAVAIVLLARVSWAGSYRTQNFMVTAPTDQLAREIANAAEAYREKLATEWIGQPMPPWPEPCPITAMVAPNLGAGGATSFYFDNARPHGWTMNVQGSRERVLDSVLPHEITHTIFATYFGRPLPRWADEGACTTVEHTSERNKQEKMLLEFLTTNRGIAFNKMFAMKDYPADVLPLYSQGYSLTRFLIAQGGKPKFVQFVGDGMRTNNWSAVAAKHYGFQDLSELQLTWVEWVRHGSQEAEASAYSPLSPERHPSVMHLASARNRGVKGPQAIQPPVPANASIVNNELAPVPPTIPVSQASIDTASTRPTSASFASAPKNGWYARQRDGVKNGDAGLVSNAASVPTERMASDGKLVPLTATRPQTPEQAKQIILEWSHPGPQGSATPQPQLQPQPLSGNGTIMR